MRIIDFLAICTSSLAHEGSAHELQQLASLFVGLRGGGDRDVHTTQLLDLVVLNLGEDDLLLQAQAVVAAAVEGVSADAAEVADTGLKLATDFLATVATAC